MARNNLPAYAGALILLLNISCEERREYKILGNIEDPQNEIAVAIAKVLSKNLHDSILVSPGIGSLANVDSLIKGKADLAIVDNYSSYNPAVTSIMPVYGQILHILHKKNYAPKSLMELIKGKKVFAGNRGSGSWSFIRRLLVDFEIDTTSLEFVNAHNLFEADVIVAFTDLLSPDELQDLTDYTLFSLDDINNLGRGSIVEGICTRYPQFDPYIISKNTYGSFTPMPLLTVKVDAILVCRASLSEAFVFDVMEELNIHKQEIATINPLLYRFSSDFDPKNLSFQLHEGARKYLARYEPSFMEKHAELLGVVISILLAIASAVYSITRWQRMKKKNKIDLYYIKLFTLRNKIPLTKNKQEIEELDRDLKTIQEETFGLVISEKLLADESFSIFLNLSRFIIDEIRKRENQIA